MNFGNFIKQLKGKRGIFQKSDMDMYVLENEKYYASLP